MNTDVVSEEEMRALLPAYEVEGQYFDRIRNKLLIRTLAVAALFIVRLALIVIYPDYHIGTYWEGDLIEGTKQLESVLLFRISVLVPLAIIYFVCLWKNFYFRSITVLSLVIICSILWSDTETHFLAFSQAPTMGVIAAITIRLLAIYLLVLNYLDVRR